MWLLLIDREKTTRTTRALALTEAFLDGVVCYQRVGYVETIEPMHEETLDEGPLRLI